MTYPIWNKPHDPYYDDYSIELDTFSIPNHMDVFVPDSGDELSCLSVIMPSPRKSAVNFTKNNKFMVIGIYRDTGRPDTAFPLITGKTYSKVGSELTVFDNTNKVRVDDYVYCYNTNIVGQQYLKCIERTDSFFTLKLASLVGADNGTLVSYRIDRVKSFQQENIVFRVFPTFKLIKYADLLQLFADTSPNAVYQSSLLIKNISLDAEVRTPTLISRSVNHSAVNNYKKAHEINQSLFSLAVQIKGDSIQEFEHNQTFDYTGKPLRLKYDLAGQVISPNYYDSKYKNKTVWKGASITNEDPAGTGDQQVDERVWCYDFYGVDINDPTRAPYLRDDIITKNPVVDGNVDNILRLEYNGNPVYSTSQFVYDNFGNIAIGINSDNTLNVIRQRIPLQLDNFGRPLKLPV